MSDVVIAGVGARSHAGLTALQVTMMCRAGKSFPRESHVRDRAGDAIAACRLPSIADNVHGFRRFLALGAAPLAQAAQPWVSMRLARREPLTPLPVFLALPKESRPGFDTDLRSRLLPALQERSGIELDLQRSMLVHRCRAGGAIAMKQATEAITRGDFDAVLVGGIDSWFDPDALEWLDRDLRLHGSATENGFIPGEGGAFVLLASARAAQSLYRHARVPAVAVTEEPRPWGHPDPCQAAGMTRALREAAERSTGVHTRRIGWMLTDVTNERHRVDEWEMAASRAFKVFVPSVPHEQPLLETGDVGAASGIMLTVIACVRWQTGCGRADHAVVATHSDGAERGVIVLGEART
jgi:3-oxoacyl-[acyl-carrier-protein] synthase-1